MSGAADTFSFFAPAEGSSGAHSTAFSSLVSDAIFVCTSPEKGIITD